MCHAFLSDISAKAQEGGCRASLLLLPLLLPPVSAESYSCSRDSSCSSAKKKHSSAPAVGDAVALGSHESLLRGQSHHYDRDPTATGRGGGGGYRWGNQDKIRYRNECLCLFACKRVRLGFIVAVHLQPEQLNIHCVMQILRSVPYPSLISPHISQSRVCEFRLFTG